MTELIDSFHLKGAQATAVAARGNDIVVSAGAGSGKTRTLVARYMSLLDEGLQPRQVLAVTFTEKAAREMRNRIRAAVVEWRTGGCSPSQRARWEEVEADIDAARIGTIHSLCAGLLRAHPAEAGIDPKLSVLDEGLAATLKAQAVEDALGWAIGIADLKPLFATFSVRELRAILAQLLAAPLEARAALQTSDLPERWQHPIQAAIERFVRHTEVVAAIADLQRLSDAGQLDADAGDKLAAQTRGLLAQWAALEHALAAGDHIAAAQVLQVVRGEYSALNIGRKTSQAKEATRVLREHHGREIEPWLGNAASPPPNPEIERQAAEVVGLMGILFEEACAAYRRAKDLRQAVDFDDLEWGATQLLERPEIRARWQRQTAAVLVDEFQDTNERQRHIVEALAGIPEGANGRLFVVGDSKQSIYRFRGADVAVFRRLDRDIRARGGLPLALDTTYRAHGPLVQALNELLGRVMGESDDPSQPYAVPFAPLQAARSAPREGIEPPYVEILCGLGDTTDAARAAAADMLARRLHEIHCDEGVAWEEIALLFRAAAGFPVYEAALEAAGIPFVTVAGKGFYDRPEIRDILNILRALADPWDDLAMAGLLRSPAFGLSDAALYQLRWPADDSRADPLCFRLALRDNLAALSELDRQAAERARESVDHLAGLVDRITVAELIKVLVDETRYAAILAAAEPGLRLQRNVDKLLADASASGIVRVGEFLDYVETLREGGAREGEAPAEAGGAVRLMSVHKAKGLEFPVVVIADASRGRPNVSGPALLSGEYGFVPSPQRFKRKPLIYGLAKALDADQSDAEDLRVLYVAATRAKEKLLICGHHSPRQSGSWLTTLAEAAGLSLSSLAESAEERQVVTLPRSGQQIAALVQQSRQVVRHGEEALCHPERSEGSLRTNREPLRLGNGPAEDDTIHFHHSEPPRSPEPSETARPAQPDPSSHVPSLYHPLPAQRTADGTEETTAHGDAPTLRIRRLTSRGRHTEGTIVGKLVHEAIRRWRFPGDPALERLLITAALASGLVEIADVAEHVRQATMLLARLRSDPRWPELDAAQRYHELPFSVLRGDQPSTGAIDLLYRPAAPAAASWHIVDFKTDHIADQAELNTLIDKYRDQLHRYRHAVTRLLGGPVETALCFLDFCDGAHWEGVG